MPLDLAVPSKTVVAELHYLKRSAEKPTRYVMEPPPGVPAWNGIDDPHAVRIEDARGREAEFTLDRNGFALVNAPSQVRDFYDADEIKAVYYPEVGACSSRNSRQSGSSYSTTMCAMRPVPASPRRRGGCTTTNYPLGAAACA